MLNKLRPRSAYDVMAALSLFIVLGGTSYAVATGSIDSREIKNGQVKRVDLGVNSVDARKVVNGSLLASDFKSGQLPAGPMGLQGIPGTTGARGPAGATNVTIRTSSESVYPGNTIASCLAGERAVGGGGIAYGGNDYLWRSYPTSASDPPGPTPTRWVATARNLAGGAEGRVDAYVVCAAP